MTCRKAPKILKTLHSENQAHLAHHRWPPVWYLKERDFYDKYVAERKKEEGLSKPLKRSRNNSGCLCFVGKTRRGDDSDRRNSLKREITVLKSISSNFR
jgi:Rho-related BTB domain-containing protein 1/2